MVEALVQQELISNSLLVISLLIMRVEYSFFHATDGRDPRNQELPKLQTLLIIRMIMHVLMMQDGRDSLILQEMALKIID